MRGHNHGFRFVQVKAIDGRFSVEKILDLALDFSQHMKFAKHEAIINVNPAISLPYEFTF
jgi:hypothetical protein